MKTGRHVLTTQERQELLSSLHPDWQSTADESAIMRLVKVADFDQALRLVNRCAALAEQHNHHPDLRFGWGYVEVSYTSHDVHGLTVRDARSARALDAIIAEQVDTTGADSADIADIADIADKADKADKAGTAGTAGTADN